MREIRIAIVSKRVALSRFFELEAERFGIDVTVYDKASTDLSEFDMCILDTEDLRRMPSLLPKRVLLISDGEGIDTSDSDVMRMGYPASIKDIDLIYARLAFGEQSRESDKTPEESVKERIYFYRELENTVRYKDRNIQLSDHEIKLLARLCESSGEPVSREELNRLLGADSGNIADVYICRLRRKLESGDGKRVIFTVRSAGYKIITDMEWE